jgi:hypothetical protein
MVKRRRLIRSVAVFGAAALLSVSGASARSAKADEACSWGASSMTAMLVNGQLVESQPSTTGCIPK